MTAYRRGQPLVAERLLRRLVATHPDWWNVHLFLGLVGRQLHRPYRQVAFHLSQSVALSRNNPWAHYHLGLLHRDHNRHALAILSLRKALQLSPTMHKARRALARSYQALGQADQALREYLALLKLPEYRFDWIIRRYVAQLHEKMGKLTKAEQAYLFLLSEPRYNLEARLRLYLFYRRHGLQTKATTLWRTFSTARDSKRMSP